MALFSLERLERLAYGREHEAGCRELLALLAEVDRRRGRLPAALLAATAPGPSHEAWHELPNSGPHDAVQERQRLICNRIAAAAAALLADPQLRIAPDWQPHVMATQRWLGAIFEASDFGDADHVIRAMSTDASGATLAIAPPALATFCWLYMPQSQLPLDIGALWTHDRKLATGLAMALLSPRLLAAPAAHAKREQILPWLAAHLDGIDDIAELPGNVLHDIYMHCSYALRPDKHEVKGAINQLIARSLQRRGIVATDVRQLQGRREARLGKPVMLVVLEWFTSEHSIWRTHSRTIEAAREHFEIVGATRAHCVDATSRGIFDAFVELSESASAFEQLGRIQQLAEQRQVEVLYMPSVGMFPLTMMLANLRIAPLQVIGLGHPATTGQAAAVDAVVVEEDYVGDAACFSEKLLRLPSDGMPYRPIGGAARASRAARQPGSPVQIALCATVMKISPPLLSACAAIAARCKLPLHFHLLIGQAQGLLVPALQRQVRLTLGARATVWPEQPVDDYCAVIATCDLFINPFPFGNTNGTIDCIAAGLVGVCKTGPEVHEHIDEAMFRRLGLPDWLIARSVEEYVDAAVRLCEGQAERDDLRQRFAGHDKVAVFYSGRPAIMGEMLLRELQAQPSPPAPTQA